MFNNKYHLGDKKFVSIFKKDKNKIGVLFVLKEENELIVVSKHLGRGVVYRIFLINKSAHIINKYYSFLKPATPQELKTIMDKHLIYCD